MEDSAISKFSKDFSSPLQSGKEEYVNLKKKNNLLYKKSSYLLKTFKVPMKWKIEVLKNKRIWKAFKSEEEWCFPFCQTSSRSRDIQDFCIMQIRHWWRHKVWHYGSQNTK